MGSLTSWQNGQHRFPISSSPRGRATLCPADSREESRKTGRRTRFLGFRSKNVVGDREYKPSPTRRTGQGNRGPPKKLAQRDPRSFASSSIHAPFASEFSDSEEDQRLCRWLHQFSTGDRLEEVQSAP